MPRKMTSKTKAGHSRIPRERAPRGQTVRLTTGYEVHLAEKGGINHLLNAIFGETLCGYEGTPGFRKRGFALIYEVCNFELHYVAGQLLVMKHSLNLRTLTNRFGKHWDRIRNEIARESAKSSVRRLGPKRSKS